jgi:hypothetical protein
VLLVVLPMAVLATFTTTLDIVMGVTHARPRECVVQQQTDCSRAPASEAQAEPASSRSTAELDLTLSETEPDSDSPNEDGLAAQPSRTLSNAFVAQLTYSRQQALISHERALTLERPPRA